MKVLLSDSRLRVDLGGDTQKVYTVYAIYFREDTEVMIFSEKFPSEPMGVQLNSVDLVDARMSRYWVLGNGSKNAKGRIVSFPEWANSK